MVLRLRRRQRRPRAERALAAAALPDCQPHFPASIARDLKILAAEEGTSVQALLEEALELLFVKKGKGQMLDKTDS